jgi:predicted lipid-binding transport protein (Tim44 family)
MDGGIQFIDIIFFALVAAFLVLRLRSVLGRRNGGKTEHRDIFAARKAEQRSDDNVVSLGDQQTAQTESVWNKPQDAANESDSVVDQGIAQISKVDPQFDAAEFAGGAKGAFEMILTAFASGDRETLKNLLNAEVYGNFVHAIDDRERQGHTLEDTLVGISSSEIVEAFMEGSIANVTTKFVSEQITVTRDGEGQIVDGNPNTAMEVTDFWTFARDTRTRDPNWELVATRSLD